MPSTRAGHLEEPPVSANGLLLWLSAKGEGSWSQFRAAVEELHVPDDAIENTQEADDHETASEEFPVHQTVRLILQRLGHVEFHSNAAQRRWRVVPSSLALLPNAPAPGAVGILCGARGPRLLPTLATLPGIRVELLRSTGMPDCIRLRSATVRGLSAAAASLGIRTQPAAPTTLLSALPSVDDERGWKVSDMPTTPGWRVHRFSSSQLRWSEVQSADAIRARTGLFRFNQKFQWLYYLKRDGRSYRVPVQVGKFAIVRRRRDIVAYDSASNTFRARVSCRPPLLVERGLILCSGVLPNISSDFRWLEYTDVSGDEARLAAQLLCQELS